MKKLLFAKGEFGTLLQFNRLFWLLLSEIVITIDLAVVIFVSFFLLFCLLMYFWTGRRKLSHPESAEAVDGTKLKEKERGTPYP